MSLPPSQGYYVTDRIDLVPPPPPHPHHQHPPHSQLHHRGPYPMPGPSNHGQHGSPSGASPGSSYSHSQSGAPSGPPPGNSYNHAPSGNPNQQSSGNSYQPSGPQNHGPPSGAQNHGPPSGSQGSMPYDEWQVTPPSPPGASKIVNRPPNPYKDQFKPSYVSI